MNILTVAQQEKIIFDKLDQRAKELLLDDNVMKKYQSKATEQEAKDWIMGEAFFTLYFSVEERMEIVKENLKNKNN